MNVDYLLLDSLILCLQGLREYLDDRVEDRPKDPREKGFEDQLYFLLQEGRKAFQPVQDMNFDLHGHIKNDVFFDDLQQNHQDVLGVRFLESLADLVLRAGEELVEWVDEAIQALLGLDSDIFVVVHQKEEELLQKEWQVQSDLELSDLVSGVDPVDEELLDRWIRVHQVIGEDAHELIDVEQATIEDSVVEEGLHGVVEMVGGPPHLGWWVDDDRGELLEC